MIGYALIGLIQGLTEFLPVSSSGHLVLAQRWLGIAAPGVLLEAFVHLGTLGAVLWVFRRDVAALCLAITPRGTPEARKELALIAAGSVPIVLAGLVFRRYVDAAFSSLVVVGSGLLLSAAALALAARWRRVALRRELSVADALFVGVAQSVALLPGVSRMGVTLAAGVGRRVSPENAARFSFLLSIPALLGAATISLWDAAPRTASADWIGILVGTLVSLLVGIGAVHALVAIVRRSRLWVFCVYCAGVGVAALIVALT